MGIVIDYIIINDLKKGNISALKKIYGLYSNKLFYFINAYARDKDVSEELVQDVFIKLWDNKENLKTSLSLNNYIYTIAKNLSIDYIRKKKTRTFPIESVDEKYFSNNNEGEFNIIDAELESLFFDALEHLSPRMKEVFKLHRIEGLTYKQISNQLGISVSAVEKNISSAIKSIQKYIAEKK